MAIGTVIHGEDDGAGGGNAQGSSYVGTFLDYNALVAAFPTANFGDLAVIENDQGTKWLPWTVGGTYYPQGTYYWDGTEWLSNVEDIAEELQNILNTIAALGLPAVLSVDNKTGAFDISIDTGQVIKASTGSATFQIKQGDTNIQDGAFGVDDVNLLTLNTEGAALSVIKSNFSKIGQVSIYNNDLANKSTGLLPQYPSSLSAASWTINQNVINSNIIGGDGGVAKTDNSGYLNQLAYNTGLAGELLVRHTPNAANFIQVHQAKSGDIALTSDIKTQSQPFVFTTNNNDFIQENNGAYTSVAKISYAGSDRLGIPRSIFGNIWNDGGISVSIQIFDVTNSLQIAELTGIVSASEANISDLGALTNVPTGRAVFEIRLLQVGGGMGDNAKMSSITIE